MRTDVFYKNIYTSTGYPDAEWAFDDAYSTSRIRLEITYYAYNVEKDIQLIRWKSFIDTTSNAYITSADTHAWTMTAVGDVNTVTQTGYTDVNTDISDAKEIASGVIEMTEQTTSDNSIVFTFTLDTDTLTHVNILTEEGKSAHSSITEVASGVISYSRYYPDAVSTGITGANNFNDENNLTVNLSNYSSSGYERVLSSLISLDGYNDLIYRNDFLTIDDSMGELYNLTLTYDFTDAEREILRIGMPNEANKEVFIFLESCNYRGDLLILRRYYVKRTLAIVNANPVFNPVVKDVNDTTLALTGDESVIVRYSSNAYVESYVELQKHAGSLVSHFISVGGRYAAAQTHTFEAVEGNTFTFTATDSRGFNTTIDINPPFVDYVKLTCDIAANVVDADTGILSFKISGNYFNDSFGSVNNSLGLSYRIKAKDAEWGSWVNLGAATLNGNTYTLESAVSGLDYQTTYDIQAMATDRLNTITTPVVTLTTIPIFDWGKEDFNFNVPVGFKGEIIADGAATFNGDIVFNGNIDFGSNVIEVENIDTANTTLDTDYQLADYIIETGEEAMGSNGTWKWQKWKSGKAEAWGKRNYGNMGISTLYYGALYQSSTFEQDLPSIFSDEPDVIDINIIKTNAGTTTGAFVLRGLDTNASSTSTGSFAICKDGSGTLSQVYLGFHIIGTWI